ncbi:MAG: DUF7519 family protein [Halapricum sp.]
MIEQRPTRFGTTVAVAATAVATGTLVRAVGLERDAAYAAIGAVTLAVVLGLLASDRLRPVGVALAGPALPAVSAAVIAGAGLALAGQLRNTLPIGSVFVVVGASLTAFGTALSIRDPLSRDVLSRGVATGARTTVVVGLGMAAALAIRFAPLRSEAATVLGGFGAWVFDPTASVPLASFVLLSIAVLYLTRETVIALPLAALLGDRLADVRETLSALDRALKIAALPLVAVALGTLLLDASAETPYAWLPDGLRDALGALTGATALRRLFVAVLAVDGVLLALTGALKRAYRGSGRAALLAVVPYVSGGAVVAAVVSYREPLVSTLIEELSRRLPAQLAGPFEELSSQVTAVYGETALALMITTGLSGLTLAILSGLFVSAVLGLLADRGSGVALAASGTVVVTAFAATMGIDLRLALVGTVAAFVAWDVGTFGVGLGDELGTRASTIRIELVHAGGTVLVGAVAVGVALAIERATDAAAVDSALGVPALVGAVAGLLLLVIASR